MLSVFKGTIIDSVFHDFFRKKTFIELLVFAHYIRLDGNFSIVPGDMIVYKYKKKFLDVEL